jgi:RNase P subunit RPR2
MFIYSQINVKKIISKSETIEKIKEFSGKTNFSSDDVKKIKKMAMKYKIKLGEIKKKFCKKCLNPLKGKIRINNGYKSITCINCGLINKTKIY